jgi:hypothetical protein
MRGSEGGTHPPHPARSCVARGRERASEGACRGRKRAACASGHGAVLAAPAAYVRQHSRRPGRVVSAAASSRGRTPVAALPGALWLRRLRCFFGTWCPSRVRLWAADTPRHHRSSSRGLPCIGGRLACPPSLATSVPCRSLHQAPATGTLIPVPAHTWSITLL